LRYAPTGLVIASEAKQSRTAVSMDPFVVSVLAITRNVVLARHWTLPLPKQGRNATCMLRSTPLRFGHELF
jgi:hypothetical protein